MERGDMTERFSASVAARQMSCHASANLELAIPGWTPPVEDSTKAANEGTNLHSLLEPMYELSPTRLRHMVEILNYVSELRQTRRFKVLVEHRVQATWLQSAPYTTADLVLYTQDELHVIDTKLGKIPVSVWNNEQLLYYAACYAPLAPKAKGVHLHILQPAANNMEVWFADTSVVAKFMADAQATEAAIAAGDTSFGPSDHCKFCPANPHSRGTKGTPLCPAMMQILYPPTINEDEILSL